MSTKLQIVDPHIHLWDLNTGLYPHFERPTKGPNGSNAAICRSYYLEEFLDEGEDEFEAVGAVHVEAFPTEPVKETEVLQKIADKSPIPLVIVSNGDLTAPDFGDLLDRHAEYPIFRGIRQVVNLHKDPNLSYVSRDLMAEPEFLDGLKLMGKRGLSFDLQLFPHQMETAARLCAEASDMQVILNHTGMWADRTLEGWGVYKAGLRALAANPNVAVKISGFGMLDQNWTLDSIRPLIFETLEVFGVDRAMFASNFPVDKLYSDYRTVWRGFAAAVSDLSTDEQAALFRENTRRFYRVPAN